MVHLRSVRMRGFKTFAKPTELVFEPGVTVIIGPNGSGKSNIADAVLWVLGEQSPGNLRGRSMQDVIFSGPEGRRSSAVAEVSLVFDNNSSGVLPLDRAELEITRRLTREAGAEYRLNGSACRLLDIQDVMGGLGLGREMHSVISQGKVEAFLNSTPEVRRAMVEEAAGLGRFKKRRERARAKLEKTRQNLLRAADIEREVKSALRPLRQQVAAAERFAAATEDWALAKSRLLVHALEGIKASCSSVDADLACVESRRAEIEARLTRLRQERAAEEESFKAALAEREQIGALFHQARAGADHMESRTTALRQRLARVEGELDRARRRRDLAVGDAESLTERLDAVMAASTDEDRLARVGGWGEVLRKALEDSLPSYQAAGAVEDDMKDAVFELETARSRTLQDRDFLRRETEQRTRVGEELGGLAAEAAARVERLEAEAAGLETDLVAAEAAVQAAEAALRAAAVGRDEARSVAEEALQTDTSLGEALAGAESRLAVLADVLRRREGAPEGARRLLDGAEGCVPLTELISVEAGYERAFAAALGPLVQAVVVPGSWEVSRALEVSGPLEAIRGVAMVGQIEAVPAARPTAGLPADTRDLWDVVSGPEGLIRTLQRLVPPTAVVVSEEHLGASAYVERGDTDVGGRVLVSRSGEVTRGGVHAARRQEVGAETLLRARNEFEEASRQRDDLLARRDGVREQVEEGATALAAAEALFRRQEERLHEAVRQVAGFKGDRDLHHRRLEEAVRQREELEGRKEREGSLVEQMLADLRAVEQGLASTEAELEKARSAFRVHQSQVEELRRTVARLEEKKGQAALVEVRLRERCRAHESERARASSQRDAAAAEVERYGRRVKALEEYVPAVAGLLSVAARLTEKAQEAASGLGSRAESSRAHSEGAALAIRDWGGVEAECQRELDSLSARKTDLSVEQARLQDRRAALEEELADLRRRHLAPRGVSAADVAGADEPALRDAVERAERRRERVGPINPLAEQECAEMEERARFLEEQRRDLEASLAQLQDVISDLDGHIERVFGEIFAATSGNFSSVIASVFPGAKGTLKLTEPKPGSGASGSEGPGGVMRDDGDVAAGEEDEDRRAGGISLEVRLPNKAPRSLSLLSGGEKAMAAIAFLFSLFLARPCPFYILDEVEASLDDINIRRFLTLVRKYRERTQFIIITHQRQTMEVADTLYGVTLESDGTSRVLSRRLATAKGA